MGLLRSMGYERLRHYSGGMADWTAAGMPLERGRGAATLRLSSPANWSDRLVAGLGNRTFRQLLELWLAVIVVFGALYWLAALAGAPLVASGAPVGTDAGGLLTAVYFSFVTALSVGYGDVVPAGPVRVLAVAEAFAGLLLFGCVISKLVSRRQEELTEEIHRVTFEGRLGRVRTDLHMVLTELQAIGSRAAEASEAPARTRAKLESAAAVLEGELSAVHDLLYRPQSIPDEQVLTSLLVGVAAALQELGDLLGSFPDIRTAPSSLPATLRSIGRLAQEICGDCVPEDHAPELKGWMDAIQSLARRIEQPA